MRMVHSPACSTWQRPICTFACLPAPVPSRVPCPWHQRLTGARARCPRLQVVLQQAALLSPSAHGVWGPSGAWCLPL